MDKANPITTAAVAVGHARLRLLAASTVLNESQTVDMSPMLLSLLC